MSANYISTESLYALFRECHQQVCTDTRKIQQGSIFFALKGENFNANSFAQKALELGCRYAIVDEDNYATAEGIFLVKDVLAALQDLARHHRRQLTIPVIGITGSNGKTTNKELIHAVLSKKYRTYATKGNLNNHIGVPLTLLSIKPEDQMAVVEMGANHQGEIDFLCNISMPTYGLITNIGKAHLEGFGGEEGVKKGKSELYRYLHAHTGIVFVNGNDPVLMELSSHMKRVLYGEDNTTFDTIGKGFYASEYVSLKWCDKGGNLDQSPLVHTHVFGHYNFINLLCAACIGQHFGVAEADINDALSSYVPEMNRSQVVTTPHNTVILDAYNANPSSMKAAIENFSKQDRSSSLLFLGDMLELGEYSKQEHLAVLRLVESYSLKAILIGPQFFEQKDQFPNFLFFNTTGDCLLYMKEHPVSAHKIMVKGSRGMKLESLTEAL